MTFMSLYIVALSIKKAMSLHQILGSPVSPGRNRMRRTSMRPPRARTKGRHGSFTVGYHRQCCRGISQSGYSRLLCSICLSHQLQKSDISRLLRSSDSHATPNEATIPSRIWSRSLLVNDRDHDKIQYVTILHFFFT